mmetsp:Transcript_21061/g.54283  ORF Transcript_21061/g.54283 Transcript_21061/m.54283 type:complete len:500 (-) Transcript_21061:55-1554(-)
MKLAADSLCRRGLHWVHSCRISWHVLLCIHAGAYCSRCVPVRSALPFGHVDDGRLDGERARAERGEWQRARRACERDEPGHHDDGRVHSEVAIPERVFVQLWPRSRRAHELTHAQGLEHDPRLGGMADVVEGLGRIAAGELEQHLLASRVLRRVVGDVVHSAADRDPRRLGRRVLGELRERHLALGGRALGVCGRARKCGLVRLALGSLGLDLAHVERRRLLANALRAPRLARAERPVPQPAGSREGEVAPLRALVVEVVVVRHLRVREEALQIVRNIVRARDARVLLERFHDAQHVDQVVARVVERHEQLRERVAVQRVHEVVERVRLVRVARERVGGLVVHAVDVLPLPRHHVPRAVRPVHGEREAVLVREHERQPRTPRARRRARGRVEAGDEEVEREREGCIERERRAVVQRLRAQVLELATREVALGAQRMLERRLRAVLRLGEVHVLKPRVVRAAEERHAEHPQAHLDQRLRASRRREVAARVEHAQCDQAEA